MQPRFDHCRIAGIPIVTASRPVLAEAMVRDCRNRRDGGRPLLVFDANGHALSLRETDLTYRQALADADIPQLYEFMKQVRNEVPVAINPNADVADLRFRTGFNWYRDSDAILLSAGFHIGLAEIADQSALTNIVRGLVSHSSLIITLYWSRRDTTCQTDAHHDLVDAIEAHDAEAAARLMRRHLTDLMSGLDLSRGDKRPNRLSDILG